MERFKEKKEIILTQPERAIQHLSLDLFTKRENIIETLKNRTVGLKTHKDIENVKFINADLTHFTYESLNSKTSKKSLLKNLIIYKEIGETKR